MNLLDLFLIRAYETSRSKSAVGSVVISSIQISTLVLVNIISIYELCKMKHYILSMKELIPDIYLYRIYLYVL